MKSKIYKLLITVALIAVCVFFLWPEEEENKNEDDWEYPVEAPRKDYDISLFKQLTNDEAAKLYDLKGTQVVFACDGEFDVCREMYKNVLAVQKEFNYTTNYIYIYSRFQEFYKDFISKLDKYTVISEETKGKFSELFGLNKSRATYFPAIIVIKDGVQVEGFIGNSISYEDLYNMIKKHL